MELSGYVVLEELDTAVMLDDFLIALCLVLSVHLMLIMLFHKMFNTSVARTSSFVEGAAHAKCCS